MYDIDSILFVVENPTRRRILQALVREPHYPLQLSKELGISQQAIMKNLDLMEKSGLVKGKKESSNKGPEKIVYRPTSEFTLTIDLRDGTFKANITSPSMDVTDIQPCEERELDDIRAELSELDREIRELDETRSRMIDQRDRMIQTFMESVSKKTMDYEMRSLLYYALNEPDWGVSEISENLRKNENKTTDMWNTITDICRRNTNDQ
jgi:Predicted transcriptional regulators